MSYQIETFCDNGSNANTYLIYDDKTCIVIDPANNVDILFKYIGKREVLGILLTHGHYDHFKSIEGVLKKVETKVYMHKNAYQKLNNPHSSYASSFGYLHPTKIKEQNVSFVKDGDKLMLNNFIIKCWYTPGHTDCMMSYIIDDNLFSGDFLFKGSIGRTDLETGDKDKMRNMIKEIKSRKINYTIYPGHDIPTTLDKEKEENYYLIDKNYLCI